MKDFGEFDYVIAGGGTAGCVLANRLSADPDVTVLLLEAGGKDDWIWIHIPIGYLKCINNPRTDWCYKTEAEPGLNGRSIIYARGKVLGGCSSINGMLYLRGQVRDYEEWAQITGDSRWNWESVLPIFKKSEDYWNGADDMHGDKGEWRVEKQRLHWDILDRYTQAAQEAGIPFKQDYNRGDNFGIGHFEVNQKKGVRWNASKAMLRPVQHRPNLKVVTGALIDKLVMEGKEARGVEFSLGGVPHRVTARIETLLTRCGFTSSGLFVMDGSKRSAHGNAYFTGFGRAKRIVFFDTLLEKLAPQEIEAVLAHELGHFKHRHVIKRIALSAVFSLAFLWLLGQLIDQPWFFAGLGVGAGGTAMGLLLFSMVLPVFLFPLAPLTSALSRRHEYEADAYAAQQTAAADLITALAKLYRDNAATLTPDPLHSLFHDSHPPASQRIARLQSA